MDYKTNKQTIPAAREQIHSTPSLHVYLCAHAMCSLHRTNHLANWCHVVCVVQVAVHRMRLVGDKANAEVELRKKLGQLLYLTNLAKVKLMNYVFFPTYDWVTVNVRLLQCQ